MDQPFSTIESALEFVRMLRSEIELTSADVERHIRETDHDEPRSMEALQLVSYKLQQLEACMAKSERLLNDFRRLRALILDEGKSHLERKSHSVAMR